MGKTNIHLDDIDFRKAHPRRVVNLMAAWTVDNSPWLNLTQIRMMTGQYRDNMLGRISKREDCDETNSSDVGIYRKYQYTDAALTKFGECLNDLNEKHSQVIIAEYKFTNKSMRFKKRMAKMYPSAHNSTYINYLDIAHEHLDAMMNWKLTADG